MQPCDPFCSVVRSGIHAHGSRYAERPALARLMPQPRPTAIIRAIHLARNAYCPMSLSTARTSCLEVGYLTGGDEDAPPVVLLHGFPDDAHCWDPIAAALVEHGFRTLAPFLRGFGPTRFLDTNRMRSGEITALAHDVLEFANALKLGSFLLVGHDWGARAAYAATALAPHRVSGLIALSVGYGTSTPGQPPPSFEQARAYWYQWYLGHPLGRAALAADRRAFCQRLWETWSPGWRIDAAAFATTAQSFDNPDFVDVAVHSYRHRWGGVPGDPRYEHAQKLLAALPPITAPTTVLHGADDGATLPESTDHRAHHFRGSYDRRVLPGVGHFIPRERPDVVLEAILERAHGDSR